jgi:hypothetical protein
MCRPVTDSPAARLAVDDPQAVSADVVWIGPGGRSAVEPVALVDHLDVEMVVVETGPQSDAARTMQHCVRHELAGQEPNRPKLIRFERVAERPSELPASDSGCVWSAGQLQCQWDELIHVVIKLPRIGAGLRGLSISTPIHGARGRPGLVRARLRTPMQQSPNPPRERPHRERPPWRDKHRGHASVVAMGVRLDGALARSTWV